MSQFIDNMIKTEPLPLTQATKMLIKIKSWSPTLQLHSVFTYFSNFLLPKFHIYLSGNPSSLSSPPPPQAALLNSFPAIFDELLQMFTVQEVAEFVRGTLGSMPSTVHIGQSMDVVKLQSIARTVDSRLFSFPGTYNTVFRLAPVCS